MRLRAAALIFLRFRAGVFVVATGALSLPLSMARSPAILSSIFFFCDSSPSMAASITSFDSFVGI
jgi:hypothetical protein